MKLLSFHAEGASAVGMVLGQKALVLSAASHGRLTGSLKEILGDVVECTVEKIGTLVNPVE